MSRPPVQISVGKFAGALLLLASLLLMVGCQGLSAGPNQAPTGNLSFGSGTLDFGNVGAGGNKTLSIIATNTQSTSVTISSITTSTQYFALTAPSLPVTIAAGDTATFTLKFTPNAVGSFAATASVTSDATTAVPDLALSGTGTADGQLDLNPASQIFGSVLVGAKQSQTVTLTNSSSTSSNISQISVSGPGFQISGISAPLTLAASQSTTFTVAFAPLTAGNASGTVTITSDAANPTLTMSLSGTGVALGALGANPASLNFGSVLVGVKQTLSETVTNSGGSSVTISQVGVSGSGFTMSGITAPVTLAAGQSATFSVSFTPSSAGAVSGNVAITSNASNSTLNIPLSGTGTAAGALGSNPTSLSFGSVQVSVKQTLSETVTNTGGSSVTISQVGVSGTGFTMSGITAPVTLTAGQSATFSVSFTPASAGAVSGNVTITSNASNPTLTIPLSGTGVTAGTLGANPSSLSFGSVQVNNNQSLSETVTNTGGSSVTISQISVTGSDFTINGITAPLTLTAGQSATFNVVFTPVSTSSVTGSITITSNASNPSLSISLSGSGSAAPGQLSATPSTLAIGNVVVNTTGTGTGSLNATGGNVTVTAVSSSNGAFSVSGLSLPMTIQAGSSASFTVTFSPQATGAASATLTFTSNATPSTTTETVTGTGVAASTHTVALSWNASTSPNISGYNVYRAIYISSCGSFGKINSSLNTNMTYTDTAVASGTSYCYATTAVDSNNEESDYSNIVSNLQIP